MVVAVGAGARDEARGDDGAGVGCAAPAGTLEVAAVDRRTAQVTRPQYAVCAWARPPGSFSSTAAPEPPSSTRPAATSVTGCHRVPASQECRRLPPNCGSDSSDDPAESLDCPVDMCPLPWTAQKAVKFT